MIRNLVLAVCTGAAVAAVAAASEADVNTQNGPVHGDVTSTARRFLGIPFAAPPVGTRRWESPQPPASWSSPLDATRFSDGCPQQCALPPGICPTSQSEDCLYLNVFTPRASALRGSNGGLPVMFFIAGGDMQFGTASVEMYDGARLASQGNIIVVTTNYRLGALGFLATGSGTGNYGLQDQRMALQWVQDNIAAFGGDKDRVTIAGQSAGGTSVACHLVSPLSKGLFAQAIAESNPVSLRLKGLPDAEDTADHFATDAGCFGRGDTDCLRGLSADAVVAAQMKSGKHIILDHPIELFMAWTPLVGTEELPEQPMAAIDQGSWANVPLMMGSVEQEGIMFVYGAVDKPVSNIEYRVALTYLFGIGDVDAVVDAYPTRDIIGGNDTRADLSVLATDYIFYCPARRVAANVVQATNLPVYLYNFRHPFSFDPWGPNYGFCDGKVCHGSELAYVFGYSGPHTFTSGEDALANTMINYWSSFVKTGNPNSGGGDMNWPKWTAHTDNEDPGLVMILDVPGSQKVDYNVRARWCDMWDRLGYTFG